MKEIFAAVTRAIKQEFGEEYRIYTDHVKQGLKRPCFLVETVAPSQERFLNNVFRRRVKFCVHYLSDGQKERTDNREAARRLFTALNRITVKNSGTFSSSGHSYEESEDGVLHFFASYNFLVRYGEDNTPPMENLETRLGGKKG